MKTQVTLIGAQDYWFVPGLIQLMIRQTGWDEERARLFLKENKYVHFHNLEDQKVAELLRELEAVGFVLAASKQKSELHVTIHLPYVKTLETVKSELTRLSKVVNKLEGAPPLPTKTTSIVEADVYKSYSQSAVPSATTQDSTQIRKQDPTTPGKKSLEEDIGKYWLPKIGVFTLVLGIAFFLAYTFQRVGPWGKIFVGCLTGAGLLTLGSYASKKQGLTQWAMTLIGGGWSIFYFTTYAAYRIPASQVITSPLIAFCALVAVSFGAISHSLTYRSRVLVFFTYFLTYLSLTTSPATYFTLIVSALLGISVIFIAHFHKWPSLPLIGLFGVYLTHWIWLEPSIYGFSEKFAGSERLSEALWLPLAGNEWRMYPLIDSSKSILHQLFLGLYWLVFSVSGLLPSTRDSKEAERLVISTSLLNNAIFATAYLHHLHVYYPDFRWIFTLSASILFLAISWYSKKKLIPSMSELYLAFSLALLAVTLPVYFDGPWITFGWATGSCLLIWLGLRQKSRVFWVGGLVLNFLVLLRVLAYDRLEQVEIISGHFPVRTAFLLFMYAALCSLVNLRIYWQQKFFQPKHKSVIENILTIETACLLSMGMLFGGPREVVSLTSVLIGATLVILSLRWNRLSWKVASVIFLVVSLFRLATVDLSASHLYIAIYDLKIACRYLAILVSLFAYLILGRWLRKKPVNHRYPAGCIAAATLLAIGFFDVRSVGSALSILWGIEAFGFILIGFRMKERMYRWSGLSIFALVVIRLFTKDLASLDQLQRIFTFMGIGASLIVASLLYNYFSKKLDKNITH